MITPGAGAGLAWAAVTAQRPTGGQSVVMNNAMGVTR
jgi:hypothetical protein